MGPRPDSNPPQVVVSVPCPLCAMEHEPHEDCHRCRGSGIVLLRVRPEHAGRPAAELESIYPPTHDDRRV